MKDIVHFLSINGFIEIHTDTYSNEICTVEILKDGYCVTDNSKNTMFSDDFNIYWLIGVLTYYGLMNKDYQQFFTPNQSFE